ncbi:glycerophosphodiester phosphodiesterase family protein [Alicyclobacillus acidocaldarius]|uniref:glycerophosphodiester phosphodiesterase family protein n=1 Tax=Alicyclobacillus acidocaldarius TaxID=405212 RepID=UPI0035BE55D6
MGGALELDVRLSADHTPVVIHDEQVDRKRQTKPTWCLPSCCLKMGSSSIGRVLVCESTYLTRSVVNFGVNVSLPSTTAASPPVSFALSTV